MRRTDKEMSSREEMDRVIRGSLVCRVALAISGMPYIVPVSFGYDGEAIYLHTAREGKKIDGFRSGGIVCFEFERGVELLRKSEDPCGWTFSYESVIGYGKIRELESPGEREEGMKRIVAQYGVKECAFGEERLKKVRIWKIEIDSMTGKRSGRPADQPLL